MDRELEPSKILFMAMRKMESTIWDLHKRDNEYVNDQKYGQDTLIQAHAGERVDIGPGRMSRGNSGGGSTGDIIVNLYNYNNDKETLRTFRRKLGDGRYMFGA